MFGGLLFLLFSSLFAILLYILKKRKSDKMVVSRNQFLLLESQNIEKPKDFYFKIDEKNNILTKKAINFEENKQKNRIKGLTKCDENTFVEDPIKNVKKINIQAEKYEIKDHLSIKEKIELIDNLWNFIKKRAKKKNNVIIDEKENQKISHKISEIKKIIDFVDLLCLITKMKSNLKEENLQKLIELCLKYEIIEWASFFLMEMKIRSIEIKKNLMDEYIKLSLNEKTMKIFLKKVGEPETGSEIRFLKKSNTNKYLKYYICKNGFRRMNTLLKHYNEKKYYRKVKLNLKSKEFTPTPNKTETASIKKMKNISLNNIKEFYPTHIKT